MLQPPGKLANISGQPRRMLANLVNFDLAGTAAVQAGATCGRCGEDLEAGTAPRVFEDLAPICCRCARRQAPELERRS